MGFFELSETRSNSRPDGKVYSCASCGLHKMVLSPRMEPFGDFKKGILNLGEAPAEMDDHKNRPWQDSAGQVLQNKYKFLGIDLFKDCININSVHCRPISVDGNCPPTDAEINACRGRVINYINQYKPKIIVLLGGSAVQSLIGYRWQKNLGGIMKWRGWTIPDRDFNAWICPTFHPSFVERLSANKVVDVLWENDLRQAFSLLNKPFPDHHDEKKDVTIIRDEVNLGIILRQLIANKKPVSIDFETTGLKPHAEGHRVECISLCDENDFAYVFPPPETKRNKHLLKQLFQSDKVPKIAHNMKFEDSWATNILFPIDNWLWDSMQATHIIDNRPGITSLKLQTYLNFGVVDYDSDVEKYLKSSSDSGNGLNKIDQAPKESLMTYCGLDTIYTNKLARIQMEKLSTPSSKEAYKLIHDGILAFSRAEQTGLRIDVDYCFQKKKELETQIPDLKDQFLDSKFGRFWKHHYGGKININSNHQLGYLLYDIKKIKPIKYSKGGTKGSTDEETLLQLQIPEMEDLIRIRKLRKIKDTYLNGFIKEQVNGVLHPFFNLHTVKTFRSSSDRVNFQNIPKRDEEAQLLCRRAIYPRPGHQLLEVDYSGVEVRISCVYNKDSKLIYDVLHGDMHGDMAVEIFLLDKMDKKIPELKTLRQASKNGFVFPQFYGDYYLNCAVGLACTWGKLPKDKRWTNSMGIPMPGGSTLGAHLISHGIKSFDAFVNHIKRIEKSFWKNRYKQYANWKKRWIKEYQKKGYFELLTGFKCHGIMSDNDVTNYPIQGTAFHCLLKSFIILDKKLSERNLDSKLVGQIHDAIVIDMNPNEKDIVFPLVRQVMCEEVPKGWEWLNVPLDIEADISPVNGSWADVDPVSI